MLQIYHAREKNIWLEQKPLPNTFGGQAEGCPTCKRLNFVCLSAHSACGIEAANQQMYAVFELTIRHRCG